ncbi:MAG: Tetraacyldisaccharide 4'-kinase [Deltaproteobacteria bacterium ADurb.Bin151]|nr:MAG: Tetraacyldisaccharide 4'-kinase [Deltaproteobacteria bacterium ADurb.Bin151]
MIDWQRIWNDEDSIRRFSPTRALLYLSSLVYRLIVALRNRLYDRQILKSVKLSCPVISVGNITVGGTGKTPCVIGLTRMLQQNGFKCAVISRGYGGKNPQSVNIVSDGNSVLLGAESAGDEPLLIARSLPGIPVITGAKRKFTGQSAIDRFGSNVLICDDAFQHRQIVRDIDIVLLDAEKPLGNGYLLPRGPLREPKESLQRTDCIILTRAGGTEPLHPDVAGIVSKAGIPVFRAAHQFKDLIRPEGNHLLEQNVLHGKKVCAFCGIAQPASFKKLLIEAGSEVMSFMEFPDHYAYDERDLEDLKKYFLKFHADYWITTEKDAMRLEAHPEFLKTVCILRVEMEIKPSVPSFEDFILKRLNAVTGQ